MLYYLCLVPYLLDYALSVLYATLSLSSGVELENDWRNGKYCKYCTRKKTAAGFVKTPCI
jgi:hypothetical protein